MMETKTQRTNWAGNLTFAAARIHHPTTLAEVQEIVRRSQKVRVLGSGHSFNDIADTPEDMIALADLAPTIDIDPVRHTATISAGLTYGQISAEIARAGYALHNMASLPHITVAGAVATATHGSGDTNGNLATAVSALDLVTADGTVVSLSRERDGADFVGAVVALGALGVVTRLTLDLVPTFAVRQDVYDGLPLAQLEDHFAEITGRAYSVSFFTDWQDARVGQVWLKRRVTEDAAGAAEPTLYGATLATQPRHPIPGVSAAATTPQMGIPGGWYERLPHFRMDFTPSSGDELQTEYLVPRHNAVAAFRALHNLRAQIAPLVQVSEVRTIAADDLWLSPCYQQACVGLHFTWRKDWAAVRQILPVIEEQLAPLGAVPHWGKVFTMPAVQVQARYPKLPDFRRLLQTYDPRGKFRNAFVDTYIFGAA